jgi:hypothetical protein
MTLHKQHINSKAKPELIAVPRYTRYTYMNLQNIDDKQI